MKNVYDIRNEKKYYFTISDKKIESDKKINHNSVGIIVNLYYREDCDLYFAHLSDIKERFPVYIISSNSVILDKAKNLGFYTIEKENRGRDLSALLVAARKTIKKYEFLCFIHDKKTLSCDNRSIINDWKDSLWNNTLANTYYICNIISLFYSNKNLGLLLPPEYPCSTDWYMYGTDFWHEDYDNVKKLITDFNLSCNIDKNIPPISIGSVFWCRTKALHILFNYGWKYSDFPAEPMPNGGTISHALERSFPYFAQSEGFETGTIMTESESINRLIMHSDYISKTFPIMEKLFKVSNISSLYSSIEHLNKILSCFELNQDVYIFGAGKIATKYICLFMNLGYLPKGIIVSNKQDNPSKMLDIPVYSIDEIKDTDIKILVCVGKKLKDEVLFFLSNRFDKKNLICLE